MRKGGESPPKSWTEEQASHEGPPFPVIMKKSRSVMTVTADENVKDYLECGLSKSYSSSSNTLGIDLWRGRRCCSGNLQLPPLSQRQSERARTPDGDSISRPTTLPLLTLPSIAITTVSQERSLVEEAHTRGWPCLHLIPTSGYTESYLVPICFQKAHTGLQLDSMADLLDFSLLS